jgi:hypothetical protein
VQFSTLRFVPHLPSLGLEPIVLTAREHAYDETGEDLLAELSSDLRVVRAIAPTTARHLAIAGRCPAALARPDRWKLWALLRQSRGTPRDRKGPTGRHLVYLSDRYRARDLRLPPTVVRTSMDR